MQCDGSEYFEQFGSEYFGQFGSELTENNIIDYRFIVVTTHFFIICNAFLS